MNFFVEKIVTGPFQENCYLAWENKTNQAILIDPGDDFYLIDNKINEKELNPIAIINTHAHLDHIGAVSELKNLYKIPFYLHEKELIILDSYEASCELFGLIPKNQ